MADIRINSLPSTATSFNTDDYIAIDGTSGGTRKMLAANPPFTDVTLGASGPSVKSTLSARAPRQGLVFDGTAGATVSVPAFGTADFSCAGWFYATNNTVYLLSASTGGAAIFIAPSGVLSVAKEGSATITSSSSSVTDGKWKHFVWTRSGTAEKLYINGILDASATDGSTIDFTQAIVRVGSQFNGNLPVNGAIVPLIYNRALSASEVVALYEAGAPSGADYNSASNTSLSTSWLNYTSPGYDTFSSASATGFSAVASTAGNHYAYTGDTRNVAKGQSFRVTFTLTVASGVGPAQLFMAKPGSGATTDVFVPTAGSNSFVLTINQSAAYDANRLFFGSTASGNFTISNLVWVPLGLLLAPDAAQAGGGLVWYDTSGNAANITLPASGVSWNVPFGNNIAASGTNQNITLTPSGTGSVAASGAGTSASTSRGIFHAVNTSSQTYNSLFSGLSPNLTSTQVTTIGAGVAASANNSGYMGFRYQGAGSTDNRLVWGLYANDQLMSLTGLGNLMVGSSGADGGQKLQVNGTITGYNTSGSTPTLLLNSNQTSTGITLKSSVGVAAERSWAITTNTTSYGDFQIRVGTSNTADPITSGTAALTLDSSQNATFAGGISGSSNRTGFTSLYIKSTGASSAGPRFEGTADPNLAISLKNTGTGGHEWQILTTSGGTGVAANGSFALRDDTAGTNPFIIAPTTGNATFAGSIAIGNTVQTAVAVASTHKVTISIGGTTYYLLATNV